MSPTNRNDTHAHWFWSAICESDVASVRVCVVDLASERIPSRAAEVLSYFVHHPRAADTLEGVARWRLREEVMIRSVNEIGEALRWLVGRGLLEERQSLGGDPIFCLDGRRAREAEQFLTAALGRCS